MTSLEDRRAGRSSRCARSARMVDAALAEMSPALDAALRLGAAALDRPRVLLRAQLVQILYAIPSERRLVEHLEYNLLLRWFVGLPLDQPVFHATSFTKNRARLLTSEIAEAFFAAIRSQAEAHKLLCREHFSVDGTLLEAAAALKSLRPFERTRARSPRPAAAGVTPTSTSTASAAATLSHRSTTDPEARLARKGARQRGQALLRRAQP